MTFSVVLKIDGVIDANENVPKIFMIVYIIVNDNSLVMELKILTKKNLMINFFSHQQFKA
jgi:hypothetical protein